MSRTLKLSSMCLFLLAANAIPSMSEDLGNPQNDEEWLKEKNPFISFVVSINNWTDKIKSLKGKKGRKKGRSYGSDDLERYQDHIEAQKKMMKDSYEEQMQEYRRRIEQGEKAVLLLKEYVDSEKKAKGDFQKYEKQVRQVEETIADLREKSKDTEAMYSTAETQLPKPKKTSEKKK